MTQQEFSNFVFHVFFVVIGIGLMSPNRAVAQNPGATVDSESVAKLKSAEMRIREQGAADLVQSRKKTLQTLLTLAALKEEKPVFRGTKELAIETLGELRLISAVPFLIKHIDYRVPYKALEDNPIAGYPCARALIAIGNPSYSKMGERLHNPMKDLEIKLFAYIIRNVDGDEIGLARLELLRKQAENIGTVDGLTKRTNLDDLIKHYKTKATGF